MPLFTPQAQSAFGGTLLAGRYRLRGVLGRGGVGEVYAADDVVDRVTVAVKVLHGASLDMVAVLRFAREARIGLRVQHAHVVQTLAVSPQESPVMFIVMELLRGQTLRQRLARGALPPHQVRRLGIALAEGLGAVHAQRVFHRDVKASNIFLADDPYALDPELGTPKLLDLGIARGERGSAETSLTTDGALVGTPQVMAPELFRGAAFDVRSEIFSLGAVLYEALIGLQAYPVTSFVDRLRSLDRLPPALTGGAWEPLLMAMMAPDPRARPASLATVLQALAAIPADEAAPHLCRVRSLNSGTPSESTATQDDAVSTTVASDVTHLLPEPLMRVAGQNLSGPPAVYAPFMPSYGPEASAAAAAGGTERLVYNAHGTTAAPFTYQGGSRPPAFAPEHSLPDRRSIGHSSQARRGGRSLARRRRRTRALQAGVVVGAALALGLIASLLLLWKFAL